MLLWLIAVRTLCVLQALQENTARRTGLHPIRNPDKPTRRSDGGGSGTPLAVTMQSLVWGKDYPRWLKRGNLRLRTHGVDAAIDVNDLARGLAKPIRQKCHSTLSSRHRISYIPMKWCTFVPHFFEFIKTWN